MTTHEEASERTAEGPAGFGARYPKRIGLALSGGGFRASIFHLGVIRRLEELGIMPDVDILSCVSGGSIIGAYYVCEMEDRLRAKRGQIRSREELVKVRVEAFEEIAHNFFCALGHDLRSRALVFAPFYHPLLFIKSLLKGFSRADILQAEYDRWFFRNNTLDQLPSTADGGPQAGTGAGLGPKLVLNAASLLSGQRVSFAREPVSGFRELTKVNKNVLPLSQVVGASAGVPGLLPPTRILGDVLVDGGVCDNQGVEALFEDGCEILLVSDASGQLGQADSQSRRALPVVLRTTSVLQHQVRQKVLEELLLWKDAAQGREFAFVHLYLNLKDRLPAGPRVPSEFIPGLGRIRTDLDQFGYIEREALMYHGYTLIDAQIKTHCPGFLGHFSHQRAAPPELRIPPLFAEQEEEEPAAGALGDGRNPVPQEPDPAGSECRLTPAFTRRRETIKKHLEAGSVSPLLIRSMKKHGWKARMVCLLCCALPAVLFVFPIYPFWLATHAKAVVESHLLPWLRDLVPDWVAWVYKTLQFPEIGDQPAYGIAFIVVAFLAIYSLLFLSYIVMRHYTLKWDRDTYAELTGGEGPTQKWRLGA